MPVRGRSGRRATAAAVSPPDDLLTGCLRRDHEGDQGVRPDARGVRSRRFVTDADRIAAKISGPLPATRCGRCACRVQMQELHIESRQGARRADDESAVRRRSRSSPSCRTALRGGADHHQSQEARRTRSLTSRRRRSRSPNSIGVAHPEIGRAEMRVLLDDAFEVLSQRDRQRCACSTEDLIQTNTPGVVACRKCRCRDHPPGAARPAPRRRRRDHEDAA